MEKYTSRAVVVIVAVALAVGLMAVVGCDGSGSPATGTAEGWVYIGPDGQVVILPTAICPPDPGYVPAQGVTVGVQGYPGIVTTTDAYGHYILSGIPAGAQTIIVTVGGVQYPFPVTIIGGETVTGGGHTEGGGTL